MWSSSVCIYDDILVSANPLKNRAWGTFGSGIRHLVMDAQDCDNQAFLWCE